jgi:hypothetical protein
MDVLRSLRARWPCPRGVPGPDAAGPALSWIGDERVAISGVPPARAVACLAEQGVTHVVNCRPRAQVRWSGDLAAERAAFGPGRVGHAPMQDHGLRQRPEVWAAAACFAARLPGGEALRGAAPADSAGPAATPGLNDLTESSRSAVTCAQRAAAMRGNLVAQTAGCSASGHSRSPTALPTLWICW